MIQSRIKIQSRDTAELRRGVGIEIAVATSDLAKRYVDIGVEGIRLSQRDQRVGARPRITLRKRAQLLLLFALALIGGERCNKGLLWNLDAAYHLHALFTLFLLLE